MSGTTDIAYINEDAKLRLIPKQGCC